MSQTVHLLGEATRLSTRRPGSSAKRPRPSAKGFRLSADATPETVAIVGAHSLEEFGENALDELISHTGLSLVYADIETVEMRMPTEGNCQDLVLLRGNTNGVLVEHTGSVLAMLNAPAGRVPAGTELSVSQLRSVTEGCVTAKATVVYQGRSGMHAGVKIRDDSGELTAMGRLSLVFVRR